jgi:hypothetical protein
MRLTATVSALNFLMFGVPDLLPRASAQALGGQIFPITITTNNSTGLISFTTTITCSNLPSSTGTQDVVTVFPGAGGKFNAVFDVRAQSPVHASSTCKAKVAVKAQSGQCWLMSLDVDSPRSANGNHKIVANDAVVETAFIPISTAMRTRANISPANCLDPVPIDVSLEFHTSLSGAVRVLGTKPAGLTGFKISQDCTSPGLPVSSAQIYFWPEGGAADRWVDDTYPRGTCTLNLVQLGTGFTAGTVSLEGQPTATLPLSTSGYPGGLYRLNVQFPGAGSQAAAIVPISPFRLVDTRSGVGVRQGSVGPAETISVQITGVGPIPTAGLQAVLLNVTTTNPTASSYVTVWPSLETRPTASSLNMFPQQTVANAVLAKVGANGKVSLYNDAGTADLIVDVTGYVLVGSPFVALSPARIMDTRVSLGTTSLTAGSSRDLTVTGVGGVPMTGIGTVVLNVTATNPTANTFVTAWPAGATRPNASALNTIAGRTVPNLVYAPVGTNGKVSFYNESGNVNLIADVVGYIPADSDYFSLTPTRLLDTRVNSYVTGNSFVAPQPLGADKALVLQVTGSQVPSVASSVVLNVTTTGATAASFLTVFPNGQTRPTASSLNQRPDASVANTVVVPIGLDGNIDIYNAVGSNHVIVDLVGWTI